MGAVEREAEDIDEDAAGVYEALVRVILIGL
jgi:hypothetical protein